MGRIWRDGAYVGGAFETVDDVRHYSPSPDEAVKRFDGDVVRQARFAYPDHCLIFGTHIGPFTAGYMAMGFERFSFLFRLMDVPGLHPPRRARGLAPSGVYARLPAGGRARCRGPGSLVTTLGAPAAR